MPSPGATSADLFGCVMADLQTHGNAYVGKYRGPDGEVAQLGCLDPSQMRIEVRGQTIAYIYTRIDGVFELGLRDLVHVIQQRSERDPRQAASEADRPEPNSDREADRRHRSLKMGSWPDIAAHDAWR